MITRRTRIQLLIFVLITVVGVAYVGTKYARLDRLFHSTSFSVTAHFAESGGAFSNAEVSYRGVEVGKVDSLQLTDSGVDLDLAINNEWKGKIPADTLAVVANLSAVGEQYVDLQPQTDDGPYLAQGSQIDEADTRTPISTNKLLTDITDTVGSVNRKALKTTVLQLGKAFGGTGQDLQRIIDTSTSFIDTANKNFGVTDRLIRDGNTVLNTQINSESDIQVFANQLSKFSQTLAGADPALRGVIDKGSFAANQLRTFIEQNRINLGQLLGELVTTGRIVVKNLPGLQQVLVLYPYVVEGSATVLAKSPATGLYDAHFGLIIGATSPCVNGYQSTNRRTPSDGSNEPMNFKAGCIDPPNKPCTGQNTANDCNPRGSQNAPLNRPTANLKGSPVVATFDPDNGKLTWSDRARSDLASPDSVAPPSWGEESWKWLYAQPMVGH